MFIPLSVWCVRQPPDESDRSPLALIETMFVWCKRMTVSPSFVYTWVFWPRMRKTPEPLPSPIIAADKPSCAAAAPFCGKPAPFMPSTPPTETAGSECPRTPPGSSAAPTPSASGIRACCCCCCRTEQASVSVRLCSLFAR
eukprot:scaffold14849_cov60-Phaeocystis_antarctica.AAC.2